MKKITVQHSSILALYDKDPEEMKKQIMYQMLYKLGLELQGAELLNITESETEPIDKYDLGVKRFEMTTIVMSEQEREDLLKLIDMVYPLVKPEGILAMNKMIRILDVK